MEKIRDIHDWKPWEKSTGAKTLEGKKRSSQNAKQSSVKKQLKAICKILEISIPAPGEFVAMEITNEQAIALGYEVEGKFSLRVFAAAEGEGFESQYTDCLWEPPKGRNELFSNLLLPM